MITSQNKCLRNKALIICSLVLTSLVFFSLFVQPTNGEFISSSSDMEIFVLNDLENGKTYQIMVGSDFTPDDNDIGFAVYDDRRCRDKDLLLTQDNPGLGDEQQSFNPTEDGDYYLGVWMNGGDYGFVDINVWEDGTSNYVTITDLPFSIWFDLIWLWIFLGVSTGLIVLSTVFVVVIGRIIYKNRKKLVVEAKAKGFGLPRYGIRKDKCPFCDVKLPPEYQPQCPYCGAPITEG